MTPQNCGLVETRSTILVATTLSNAQVCTSIWVPTKLPPSYPPASSCLNNSLHVLAPSCLPRMVWVWQLPWNSPRAFMCRSTTWSSLTPNSFHRLMTWSLHKDRDCVCVSHTAQTTAVCIVHQLSNLNLCLGTRDPSLCEGNQPHSGCTIHLFL